VALCILLAERFTFHTRALNRHRFTKFSPNNELLLKTIVEICKWHKLVCKGETCGAASSVG